MSDMVKAERQKTLSRKTTKILFVAGILLIIAYFFFFQFFYNTVFYNYETGKMDSANGFAAIEQRKEIAALFDGKLTKDTLMEMQQKLTDAKASTEGQDENSVFSATYVYRDQAAILEHMVNGDGSMKSLHEAYPNSQSVTLGYCDGWDMMLSGMGGVLSLLMCLIVVIGLSPVFAEEYTCHTDSVICAARYGGVFAKMQTYLGIVQPTAMGILNLGLIAIFYALTKSTFKQH